MEVLIRTGSYIFQTPPQLSTRRLAPPSCTPGLPFLRSGIAATLLVTAKLYTRKSFDIRVISITQKGSV